MSYILDALKRADAERERGQVPGLHAQSIDASAPGRNAGGGVPRWALAAGGGTALVIVAALAWRMGADANAPLPAPMVAPTPAPVVAAAPAPVVAATPAPSTAPVIEAPAPFAEPVQPSVAAAPEPAPAPAPAYVPPPARPAKEAPRAATRPAPVPAPAYVPQAPAPAPESARAAEPAPAPSTAVPLLAELPGSVRQQMPALTVTGSVYSEDAHARFIMLNGEVVKEGGQPAPGVVVERIDPKSAVLRFKGQRFRLPY